MITVVNEPVSSSVPLLVEWLELVQHQHPDAKLSFGGLLLPDEERREGVRDFILMVDVQGEHKIGVQKHEPIG